ncbi:hypothetical protein UY416_03230 [Paenibacillus polymyxa]|uniref:hypothetical protein n=1 Tax=Paenibacillus polymyxa TaxID=1406 RepID=UPI002AB5BD7B|nr:hypothetical protein [Paenibacillus polymyxa]MDY8045303.1 hypothetical protein [Paenibacillus polymyxa]
MRDKMSINQWTTENLNLVSLVNIILTILLTALNVWFARNSQKYSADTLRQNEKIRQENNTPNIVAYLESEDLRDVSFKLSNIGINAAKNIQVILTPVNREDLPANLKRIYILNNIVAFLAPNQTLNAFIGSFFELMDTEKTFPIFNICIRFEDLESNLYERSYVVDLNMYAGYENEIYRDIGDIHSELQKIEKQIAKFVQIYDRKERRIRKEKEAEKLEEQD